MRLPAVNRVLFAVALLGGLVLPAMALAAPKDDKEKGGFAASQEEEPVTFQGVCEDGESGGHCTIDEPEGNNPATHGLVEYTRSTDPLGADTITFEISPTADDRDDPVLIGVHVCIREAAADDEDGTEEDGDGNPYVPVRANTCGGSSEDRVFVDEEVPVENPVTITLADHGLEGKPVHFALHINLDDNGTLRTTYVTGGSESEPLTAHVATRRLTVTNHVKDGAGTGAGAAFGFTVDCGGYSLSSQNNSDEDVSYEGGDAAFTLADDGAKAFTGIPVTASCTVTETQVPEGEWATNVNDKQAPGRSASASMSEDRSFRFTNAGVQGSSAGPPSRYTLTVAKEVEGGSGDEEFTFTVDCGQALNASNGGSAGVAYEDGDAVFNLGDGGSHAFEKIVSPDTCTVSEDVPEGDWATSINGTEDPDRAATVTMDADRSLAFTNTAEGLGGGGPVLESLTVSKRVAGGNGEVFSFAVDCSPVALTAANGEGPTYEAGVATFELGDDDAQVLEGIPRDTTCTVDEDDSGDEWTTTVDGEPVPDGGVEVQLSDDAVVRFLNTFTEVSAGAGSRAGGQEPPPQEPDAEDEDGPDGDEAPDDGGAPEGDPPDGGEEPGAPGGDGGEPGDGDDAEVAGTSVERGAGSLAVTGQAIAGVAALAAALIGGGASLVRISRARR